VPPAIELKYWRCAVSFRKIQNHRQSTPHGPARSCERNTLEKVARAKCSANLNTSNNNTRKVDNKMLKINHIPTLGLLVIACLTACGGGGGGSAPATTPGPSTPAPVVPVVLASTASTIVGTAPTPTYAAGTEELAVFNKLNAERLACGFGVLAQNASLDSAAKNHADWSIVNFKSGHTETASTPGFTGITAGDRAVVAGYSVANGSMVTEQIGTRVGTNTKAVQSLEILRGLLNAPYHLAGLVSGYRDVGIAVRNAIDAGNLSTERMILQISPAYKVGDGAQVLAASEVRTYPCQNSSDIAPALEGEDPNPVPGRNLSLNPLGSSVYIAVREGNTITITNSAMTNLTTGVPVSVRPAITLANDPNNIGTSRYLRSDQAFISADVALDPNTRYQVVINGTNNGAPFNRDFIFTTGLPTRTLP
jgi:uncharacterized protein YkwD